MTPKEKAEELINKFLKLTSKHKKLETAGLGALTITKQCALISIYEIIKEKELCSKYECYGNDISYWKEVKQEIEKL